MDLNVLIGSLTIIITFICGLIAKRAKWFNNKLIPIQNLLIGVIAGIIYYLITKDIDLVIMTVGLGTGGAYDLIKNTYLLFNGDKS